MPIPLLAVALIAVTALIGLGNGMKAMKTLLKQNTSTQEQKALSRKQKIV